MALSDRIPTQHYKWGGTMPAEKDIVTKVVKWISENFRNNVIIKSSDNELVLKVSDILLEYRSLRKI
jgi:hypothetical protein